MDLALNIDSFEFLWGEIIRQVSYYRNVLACVGVLFLSKKALDLAISLYTGLKAFVFGRVRPARLRKLGNWAVITGPTSGIGRAFAIEFARNGLNVALLGRNLDKLTELSCLLQKSYGITTMNILLDFSDESLSYENVKTMFESIDVGVCVNNVGVITEYPAFLAEISEKKILEMINVNVKSVTLMTKLAVSHMVLKKRGLIVNVSSIASFGPTPLMAVYSATKAYVSSFSRAIHEEVKNNGVTVQTLTPSYVRTRMVEYSSYLTSSWMVPTPETYVKNAMHSFGYSNYTTGYWMHGFQLYLISFLPLYTWMYMTKRANMIFRQKYLASHRN